MFFCLHCSGKDLAWLLTIENRCCVTLTPPSYCEYSWFSVYSMNRRTHFAQNKSLVCLNINCYINHNSTLLLRRGERNKQSQFDKCQLYYNFRILFPMAKHQCVLVRPFLSNFRAKRFASRGNGRLEYPEKNPKLPISTLKQFFQETNS